MLESHCEVELQLKASATVSEVQACVCMSLAVVYCPSLYATRFTLSYKADWTTTAAAVAAR